MPTLTNCNQANWIGESKKRGKDRGWKKKSQALFSPGKHRINNARANRFSLGRSFFCKARGKYFERSKERPIEKESSIYGEGSFVSVVHVEIPFS